LLCLAIAQPVPRRALVGWRWFAAFALCWFCGRLAVFALAQVWLQWGLHRYAETNHLLAVFLAAIMACWLGSELRWLANRRALRKLAAS
ncbi:MAG TPA: hypothetical protein PKD54_10935, partial [Pirellulaceae bacterium]|nr:hypothetical protein [Pirellulaceae bacterium]